MSVTMQIDSRDLGRLGKRVQKFLSTLGDQEQLYDGIGMALVSQVQDRFREGKGPDGVPWEKAKRGGQTLVDSGRLRDSVTHSVDGSTVKVGTNVIYAKSHQFGATIKPKSAKVLAFTVAGKPVFAKSITIPARPFLGFDDDSFKAIRGEIADFVRMAKREARV
ncbi:MAG: phage virion morphogenesis protein [Methylocystaceae bacterium]|nr:phage virion morphogenesis protein [Methylocystaceae bacterium]